MRTPWRAILMLAAAVTAPAGQTAAPEADWTSINRLLGNLQVAVAAHDLEKANHAAGDLWSLTVHERSRSFPGQLAGYLRDAEARVAANPRARASALPWMAKLAWQTGDPAKAEQYAREALASPSYPYGVGDSIHDGNMVLGLLALKRSDVTAARAYLLAAAKTPGTMQTRRAGPDMKLAAELSARGEFATVIEYLETVRKMVTGNQSHIDDWLALLTAGRQPDFRRNFGN